MNETSGNSDKLKKESVQENERVPAANIHWEEFFIIIKKLNLK
jgi:hypothetical protein